MVCAEMSETAHGRATRKSPQRHLLELSINHGMAANDLARESGVSGNTVRAALRGTPPGPRAQLAISSVFGLEPLDIWPIDVQRRLKKR